MEKRNYKIYAVDFDGTLCENAWPEIGKPNDALINRMIELREEGNKIILWTCRTDDKLTNAVDWCKEYGLEFDAINENVPEILETFGTEARKIYADIYVDDRAVDLEVILYWFDRGGITMTVKDILEKIEELNKLRYSLRDIYSGCYGLSSDDSDAIYDAYDAIEEYIGELKKKEVKE